MEPVSIVGLVGTCLSLVATTSKTIKTLHDLKSSFSEVAVEITHLLSQVSTIQSSVQLIQQWLNLGPPALQSNPELRKTIEQALEDCNVIISAFEKHSSRIGYAAGIVPVKGKIRHLFDQDDLTKNQQALGCQMQALTLLLQAIQMTSVVEQQQLMAQKETRIVLKQVRDDASSYIDSRHEQFSMMEGTIRSSDDGPDAVFDFDDLVLDSQAYRSTFRTLVREKYESQSNRKLSKSPGERVSMKARWSSPARSLPPSNMQDTGGIRPAAEFGIGSNVFETAPRMGDGLDLEPSGNGLGSSKAPKPVRPGTEPYVPKKLTFSAKEDPPDCESSSSTTEKLPTLDSANTIRSEPRSNVLVTSRKPAAVQHPSKHIFFLSEPFPGISDTLGHRQRPIGVLRFHIFTASGFRSSFWFLKSIYYVRVKSAGKPKGRTLGSRNSTEATYNEVLYVPIDNFYDSITLEVHESRRLTAFNRCLGIVAVNPLDFVEQDEDGKYVSRVAKRPQMKDLLLNGEGFGTLTYSVTFYPCVRLVCTELLSGNESEEERSKSRHELSDAPSLPPRVPLTHIQSLSYKSGVFLFKLGSQSTHELKNVLVYVDSAPYPSYMFEPFDARKNSTSRFGSIFVRNVLIARVLIEVQGFHNTGVVNIKVIDLLTNDYLTIPYKTVKVPSGASENEAFTLRFSSFFFPLLLPNEESSETGILRIDVTEGRDFVAEEWEGNGKIYCSFRLNGEEVYRTKLQETGSRQDWEGSFSFKVSSRIADTVKLYVLEYPSVSGRPHMIIGKKDLRISDLSPFKAESWTLNMENSPAAVKLRVLFQPDVPSLKEQTEDQ